MLITPSPWLRGLPHILPHPLDKIRGACAHPQRRDRLFERQYPSNPGLFLLYKPAYLLIYVRPAFAFTLLHYVRPSALWFMLLKREREKRSTN